MAQFPQGDVIPAENTQFWQKERFGNSLGVHGVRGGEELC